MNIAIHVHRREVALPDILRPNPSFKVEGRIEGGEGGCSGNNDCPQSAENPLDYTLAYLKSKVSGWF